MITLPGEAPPFASSLHSPEEAILTFLKRLPDTCRLLVAFSGGGDSTGLLAALQGSSRDRPGLSIHAATVDHGLRAGSAGEARAAGKVCERLGVSHAILEWAGEKPSTGIQAAARMARYRLLAAEAARIGAAVIVTGHTADDQRETLAMRRARDSQTKTAMDEAVLVERHVWVARPFLPVDREAIRRYLVTLGLPWSEDPSNDNPAFERVRVRRAGLLDRASPPMPNRAPFLAAALLARESLRVHPGPVASIAVDELPLGEASVEVLLANLIAILGGRTHGPGRAAMQGIVSALSSGEPFRRSVGRVVLDRRRDRLYLCREERGLPDLLVAPGQVIDWDGRYEVGNGGAMPVRIAAGRALTGFPALIEAAQDTYLPNGVVGRAGATAPRVIDGAASTLRVRQRLAPYEHFLTCGRFELAESLATAFGLDNFPANPLRIGAF